MTKKKEVRYETNPFVENMIVPVGTKNVKLSKIGKENDVLVNEVTGEVRGTHVTTYKKVDTEKFVKLFTANIAMTFDLNAAGIKAFNVLMYAIQHQAINRDIVILDKFVLEDFLETHELKLSIPTFMRGLRVLEDAQIIAKCVRRGTYFINPNFAFSGDRIAFTTVIERMSDDSEKTSDIEDQLELQEH
ncbi:20.9 kDa protein [Vibrio crassostreae]|jgi:DNA-binding transcriptional ArsR family regulator|nr:20.9 kDa protein [Vibrio crassostreae]CAK3049201.1 20.9 kDa protein [Vibrio crassostreae]CAK3050680.1 20.9 kDa protein [Vibrio crassostreae]CAK3051176.1 20.9 kDa protein [Vibrio crassostreae]CAK3056117.1 20.9 kDa protein [Vibrio crassostreae]